VHHAQGATVAGRYQLDHRLVDVDQVALWRGRDIVLDRPVAVRLVDGSHPRATDVLDAARSTARVDDRRVARVLDADRVGDSGTTDATVYVVTAWALGRSLTDLLADGPLEPDEVLLLVGEVADVVVLAHEAGLPHLALDPTNVVVADLTEGDLTVLGLAVDAVLWGNRDLGDAADAPAADARGLGALLYAGLTARWPFDDEGHGLTPAPQVASRLCTPRQVRADVPAALDILVRRALGEDVGDGPLDTPAAVADAIRELAERRARGRWRLFRRSRRAENPS
jgi:hypothetical protein